MKAYISRRLIETIPVLFIILIITFCLIYVSGDPVMLMLPQDATEEEIQTLREALNLDEPFYVQFATFFWNALHGDFGKSFRYNRAALPLVLERLPATFKLAGASVLILVLLAVPLGILSATHKDSFAELTVTTGAVLGQSMPNFWVGIMLILIVSVKLRLLPVSGSETIFHLILPAITLGTGMAAYTARLTHSSLLEALHQDYIRTAKSKGLKKGVVVYKHALRNALIPVVTMIMLQSGRLAAGALVTEAVFAWPGVGRLLVQSVNARDMAVVQAAIFVVALVVILFNLLADIINGFLDPRITYR